MLETRIRAINHPDIPKDALFVTCTNAEVNRVNEEEIAMIDCHTHHYFIEHVSACPHPKVMLASRYITFHKSLVNSGKFPVRFLARIKEKDRRTTLCRTLHTNLGLCKLPESSLETISATTVKRMARYMKVPPQEQWRLPLLTELLKVRSCYLELGQFVNEEVDSMILYL